MHVNEFAGFYSGQSKVNLLGLSLGKLENFFAELGEKRFRAHQVSKWIHQCGVDNFDDMTNLSLKLKEHLKVVCEISPPELVKFYQSSDGSCKWLIKVTGGSCVEAVFIPENGRGTLCVSSQVGCALDCSFCATGKQGFHRDLSVAEIVGQLWLANKSLNGFGSNVPRIISNVVLMGMGEPLLNFDNVVDSVNLMMNDHAYGLSKRRVTLSTSGVVPMLDQLGSYTDVSLAVSLHAATDELRNILVPINRKYPIAQLLDSVKKYLNGLPDKHRKVTIEYTLMKDVNDNLNQALELANLLIDVPCKINLIPFNPFPGSQYQRPDSLVITEFRNALLSAGYIATVRTTRGDDINAACGQLAGLVNDKTSRSFRYRNAESFVDAEPVRLISGS
jgi:23S rRNA (adenine2503-C2)-methyltransferase